MKSLLIFFAILITCIPVYSQEDKVSAEKTSINEP